MFHHVELVARAVGAPIVLYNVPGRTGVELGVETMLRILDACPNVVGIKDATGNVMHCQELHRRAGDRVAILCGDDPLTVPMMVVGVRGVISVTANLYPKQVAEVCTDALNGRWEAAKKKHLALLPIHRVLFIEPNPQPTKAALAHKGLMNASVRPPLVPASPACREAVSRAIAEYERS
jgi:4-hydroxy-tetrahydrodipicolinate synthase